MGMNNEEPIKDFWNTIIGYIETKPNGDKVAKDFYHKVLGFYDKALNITTNFYKRKVANGDATVGLVYAEAEDRKAKLKALRKNK